MSRVMRRVLCLWVAAVSLALVAAPARAAGVDRSEPKRHPELQQLLDQVVAAGSPGAVALLNDGSRSGHHERIWTGASGVADLRSARPMRPELGFRVGSLTKS